MEICNLNINDASVQQLTQLPGIAKNMAYRIVNHRNRHGLFVEWIELEQLRGFPVNRLDDIRKRAVLRYPGDGLSVTPRTINVRRLQRMTRKPAGYTRAIRSTRMKDRLKSNQ
jgi:predicted DNA-binding helix-hairpin-helix protein